MTTIAQELQSIEDDLKIILPHGEAPKLYLRRRQLYESVCAVKTWMDGNTNKRIVTVSELRGEIGGQRELMERELDVLTARLVESGIATQAGPGSDRHLIVRGQANLLDDLRAQEDLERIRMLFGDLETQTDVIDLLTRAEDGDGVRIFIGSENKLFSMSGSSMVAAPFRDAEQRIVGVVGIIGPTRLNYARIVPMVDYTAKVVGRLLDGSR